MWYKLSEKQPKECKEYLIRFIPGSPVVAAWENDKNIFTFTDGDYFEEVKANNEHCYWMEIPPIEEIDYTDIALKLANKYVIETHSHADNDFQNAMNIAAAKAYVAGYIEGKK